MAEKASDRNRLLDRHGRLRRTDWAFNYTISSSPPSHWSLVCINIKTAACRTTIYIDVDASNSQGTGEYARRVAYMYIVW